MLKKSVNDKILIILIVSSFSNARITFVRVKVALPATYAMASLGGRINIKVAGVLYEITLNSFKLSPGEFEIKIEPDLIVSKYDLCVRSMCNI